MHVFKQSLIISNITDTIKWLLRSWIKISLCYLIIIKLSSFNFINITLNIIDFKHDRNTKSMSQRLQVKNMFYFILNFKWLQIYSLLKIISLIKFFDSFSWFLYEKFSWQIIIFLPEYSNNQHKTLSYIFLNLIIKHFNACQLN